MRLPFRGGRTSYADIAAGRVTSYSVDPAARPERAAELAAFAAGLPRRSEETRRLRLALAAPARAGLLDLLAARQPALRLLAARLCGALELEEAVPWLELRLSDRNRAVRQAAARALGRVGGARAADALLSALARERVPWSRLTVELAKAAPALHLESAVVDPDLAEQRPAVMIALALRRRDMAAAEFLSSAPIAGPRDLIAACHVLARSHGATAWVAALLDHPDRRVRAAADRALRRQRTAAVRPVRILSGGAAS